MVNVDKEKRGLMYPEIKWAVKGDVASILHIQNSYGILPDYYTEDSIEYAITKMVTRVASVGRTLYGFWIGGIEKHGSGSEYRLAELYVAKPALGTSVSTLLLDDVMQAAVSANNELKRLARVTGKENCDEIREVTLRVPEYLTRQDHEHVCVDWLAHKGFIATGVVDRDFYKLDGKSYDGFMFAKKVDE